ncbi:MAG TPA: hypothetical protein PKY29_02220 [Ferruginibacter sp.]|nr:hypothetical protein [Ferruginibacter sp.]HRN78793.1 hypothetical protein [Ferruginibacter sp.]HRO16814.1 hypothetical protein [Ferruginibacter sp.]HRQ20097.1 hypothetical protein [Ferruginibacter sp.]
MNNPNRDLLVIFNQELMTPKALEQEVSLLHQILQDAESVDNIAYAHEILDLNRFRHITAHHKVKHFFRMRHQLEKPFVFLNNKN